jgi:hypothetical protein
MQFTRRAGVLSLLASAALTFASALPASAQKSYSFAYDQPKTTAYGVAGDCPAAK